MSYVQTYERTDFTNDFIFCKVMTTNEEICKSVAELVVGRKISKIVKTDDQKSVKLTEDGKGIRMDVYFEDDELNVYDIEMQTTDTSDLGKRTRYYQGIIDLNVLNKGNGYNALKNSYIVFICTFDPFGEGLHKYTFHNKCEEHDAVTLEDGAEKIFVNANGTGVMSDAMQDFLNLIAKKETNGLLSEAIKNAVDDAHQHKEWRTEYMTLYAKIQEEKEKEKNKVYELFSFVKEHPFALDNSLMEKFDCSLDDIVRVKEILLDK